MLGFFVGAKSRAMDGVDMTNLDAMGSFGHTFAPDFFGPFELWSLPCPHLHTAPTPVAKPRKPAKAKDASARLLSNSGLFQRKSWNSLWASTTRFPQFASAFAAISREPKSGAGAKSTKAQKRSYLGWLGLASLLIAVLGAIWLVGSTPNLNNSPNGLQRVVQQLLSALGATAGNDLPAEWQVDLDKIDKKPADLALTAPLDELQNPFTQADAIKALDLYRQGRFAESAALAEKAWKAFGAKDSQERLLFAVFLTQSRMNNKDVSGAIQAARVAALHPSLGHAALRFLAARADDQGQSRVVLALLRDERDQASRVLRARSLRRSGDLKQANEEMNAVQAAKGGGIWRKWAIEQVRLLHAQGKEDAAVAQARALMAAAPKATQAEEAVDFLIGAGDAVWRSRLEKRAQDGPAVLDALVYTAQRRRYPRAIEGFAALAAQKDVGLAVQCHALSWLAKCYDRKAQFDKSLPVLQQIADDCTPKDAESLKKIRDFGVDEPALGAGQVNYRLGRAQLLQGKMEGLTAIKQAVLDGLAGMDGDDAKTLIQLAKLPDASASFKQHGVVAAQDYAERDIVDVVAWRFAQERMNAAKWADALPILDRMREVRDIDVPGLQRFDDRDWARGRDDYFAGRALTNLGKTQAGIQRWQRVVRRHPLSYYATMALSQLKHAGADETIADLQSAIHPKETAAVGPQIDEKFLQNQAIQRGRLLGLLGLHDEAGDELDSLGLGRDVSAEQKWAAGDPGGAWARAALDAEAGRWISSHATGRDALRRFATEYPNDNNRQAWQLTYPRAYRTLIEAAAAEFGLHPSVVWAICRSESGFNPRVESHAAAIGLLQLILPTAQAMAKPLGLTADATTLRQPAVNVRLGARYLKLLLNRFDREAQMAAGYNAGGGAVGRWRKTRGDWAMDLFVESIPFRETRDYAKRVVSSIAIYRNLYDNDPLHAFALNQKAVPVGDEAPTEPSSASGSAAPAASQVAQTPAQPVQVAEKVVSLPRAKSHLVPSHSGGRKSKYVKPAPHLAHIAKRTHALVGQKRPQLHKRSAARQVAKSRPSHGQAAHRPVQVAKKVKQNR